MFPDGWLFDSMKLYRCPFFHSPDSCVNENTVPPPFAPPTVVAPKRLPLPSRVTPARGRPPSVKLKSNDVICHCPGEVCFSSNTVPQPSELKVLHTSLFPPELVVPYRFPAASNTSPARGSAPSPKLSVKAWRIVSCQGPFPVGDNS